MELSWTVFYGAEEYAIKLEDFILSMHPPSFFQNLNNYMIKIVAHFAFYLFIALLSGSLEYSTGLIGALWDLCLNPGAHKTESTYLLLSWETLEQHEKCILLHFNLYKDTSALCFCNIAIFRNGAIKHFIVQFSNLHIEMEHGT